MSDVETVLNSIYYNVNSPSSFSSVRKLYSEAKSKVPFLTEQHVKDYLQKQLVYTLHRPSRRRFQRNKVISGELNEVFQADLVDMRNYKNKNDGCSYLLTVIDVLSKYAFVVPLKNKSGKIVALAMEQVFEFRTPNRLVTDEGKEFFNKQVKDILKKYFVYHTKARNPVLKASVCERFNRTLKSKIFKVITYRGTGRYIDDLPNIVTSYNKTVHSSIGRRPIDVTIDNQKEVKLYLDRSRKNQNKIKSNQTHDVRKGDSVRLRYQLDVFDKGYLPRWSDVVYKIHSIDNSQLKTIFKLKDSENEVLGRHFYLEDIQKIHPVLYRVERIIKKRTRKGISQCLVKWIGYPESSNSWVNQTDIVDISS